MRRDAAGRGTLGDVKAPRWSATGAGYRRVHRARTRPGHRRRPGALLALVVSAAVALSSCSIGPAPSPEYVTDRGGRPGEHADGPPDPPELSALGDDIVWSRDCGEGLPSGGIWDCGTLDAALDPGNRDGRSIDLEILRLRTDRTPDDAAPIVVLGGPDSPARATLAGMVTEGRTVLADARPLVAVSRRAPVAARARYCLDETIASTLLDQVGDGMTTNRDPETALITASRSATLECGDAIRNRPDLFSPSAAASDIEALRTAWGVDRLAVLGIGDGATVARLWAAAHPEGVSRLILDSPRDPALSELERGRARVRALGAALESWADECTGSGECPLGRDPLVRARRALGAPGPVTADPATDRAPVPTGAALRVLVERRLAELPAPGRLRVEAVHALADLIRDAEGGGSRRLDDALRGLVVDGPGFVARCGAEGRRPSVEEARSAATSWEAEHPGIGRTAALDLLVCNGWPVLDAPSPGAPDAPGLAVLVVAPSADPVTGLDAAASVRGAMQVSGRPTGLVRWGVPGHSGVRHSRCVQEVVERYMTSGEPADADATCGA